MALSLLCLFFLILAPAARGEVQTDLLSIVRVQHRAARESIRTLSADVSREATLPRKRVIARGKYWRSLDTVRVQEVLGNGGLQDTLVKDGEARMFGRPPVAKARNHHYGVERRPSATFLGNCDAWRYLLIEFIGPSEGRYDYDRFLDLAKSPPGTSRETIDGHECIRVSMKCDVATGKEWFYTFWHDIKRNYLIRKEILILKEDMSAEYDILEFPEAPPGTFVPVRSRLRVHDKGKLQVEEIFTLSGVHVNEGISKDAFVLPAVPAGTMFLDRIEGTKYPIDENWKRIGTAKPLEKPIQSGQASTPPDDTWQELATAKSAEGTPRAGRSSSPATESHVLAQEEPESMASWILPVSVSLLALAAALGCWIYKRRRSR